MFAGCFSKKTIAFNVALLTMVVALDSGCSKKTNSDGSVTPGTSSSTNQPPELTDEIVAQHNAGVAMMGRFDYSAAYAIFQKLADKYPNWHDVQVDWAIAALNRREPGDGEKALQLLNKIIASDPSNLRAHYCVGILALDGGDPEAARKAFAYVAEADPDDAYALYYTGQCLSQLSKNDEALERFRKVIELDPYMRSAYYGAFQALIRQGDLPSANEFRKDFERLADNPQARLAEIKYTRMGPKATVLPIAPQDIDLPTPTGAIFASAVSTNLDLPPGHAWNPSLDGVSITSCDIDMDGDIDLFIANGLVVDGSTKNAVLFAEGESFDIVESHPLSETTRVNAALWGDYDNDGFVDVYLCRSGPNQLWRQSESHVWSDVTESTGTSGGDRETRDGAIVDTDHDGDLDLFLANDGPNELLNNNLDGTFRELGKEFDIAGGDVPTSTVLFADLDNDRDADILVINDTPPHQVLLNDRLWSYKTSPKFEALIRSEIELAVAADMDTDGQLEIYSSSAQGILVWQPDANREWKSQQVSVRYPTARRLDVVDAQGDGELELVVSDSTGHHFLSPKTWTACATTDPLEVSTIAPLSKLGPSVVGLSSETDLVVQGPGQARYPFLTLSFSGKENKGEQMRSNRSGIGVDASVRRGTQWTAVNTFKSSSGPGQSLGPVQVGLGRQKRVDFVQMTWPDGVFQTEVDLPAGKSHRIEETQRQVASCPVLFAWDGQQFEFVTDVLGVGGIGFNLGKGVYSSPRPWENIALSERTLAPRDGSFQIRIGEPMEEVCYLDAARLFTYDLPPEWEMVLDERLGIADPQPTGRAIFYREELLPSAAKNHLGEDILDELKSSDFRAVDPGELDRRFLGRTSKHSITLTFDQPINGSDAKKPVLVFDGWIEYPYSQTMFAAWQANASFDAPTIEAKGRDGKWRTIVSQFGYMAGMPRRSAFPLPTERLPPQTRQLRITSNLELYWDRVSVAMAESCPDVQRTENAIVSATAAESGYATRTTLAQRRPHYDYSRRLPLWDCRHMTGFYTSFGDCLPLVEEADDAVAIIGPGEEVQLSFSAELPVKRSGWSRTFVLELDGWAKDKDLYTKDGDTVGPLPRRDDAIHQSDRESLHQQHNGRFRSGT